MVTAVKESAFEQHLTVFSPQGRLYQVEYAEIAAQTQGPPALVSLKGRHTCIVAARRRPVGRFIEPDSAAQIYQISKDVGCAVCGVPGEILVHFSRNGVIVIQNLRGRAQASFGAKGSLP